jgi:hypothetical protein
MKLSLSDRSVEAVAQTDTLETPESAPRSGAIKLVAYLIPSLVALMTLLVFSPALRNGFVNWDDLETIVDNENFRGFTGSHLRWMFTTFHLGHYQPLSWLSFALDYLFWGLNPFGYHLTNILLHAANGVLFYFVTLGLLRVATPSSDAVVLRLAAGFSALFFAMHPLRAESVAWVTERRDVLSGFFLLSTILSYLKAVSPAMDPGGKLRWGIVSVALYVLSLLSKASGMTLPLVLLILDVYPLRRLGGGAGKWFGADARPVWLEKLPFFIAALAAGVVALAAQHTAGALVSAETHDLTGRVIQGLYGISFYLVKTALPTNLAPLYEIPPDLHLFDWRVVFAAIIFLLCSLGFFLARHRWPAALAGWIAYLLLLAPVLGVAQSGLQLVADRYSYLSCLVWAILFAALLIRFLRPSSDGLSRPGVTALSLAIPLFVLATEPNLARFGNAVEPRAGGESFEHGLLPRRQVRRPARRFNRGGKAFAPRRRNQSHQRRDAKQSGAGARAPGKFSRSDSPFSPGFGNQSQRSGHVEQSGDRAGATGQAGRGNPAF